MRTPRRMLTSPLSSRGCSPAEPRSAVESASRARSSPRKVSSVPSDAKSWTAPMPVLTAWMDRHALSGLAASSPARPAATELSVNAWTFLTFSCR